MPLGLLYVAIVSLVIGMGMLGFWSMAVLSGKVPEIREGRIDIWFHLAAEFITALALIGGGGALFVDERAPWSVALSSAALGLLAYTLIASPGYYAERRDRPMVGMFVGFWLLTIPAVILRFLYL
jgi:hypothetical protein